MENNSLEARSESETIEALENGALNPRELNKPTLTGYIRIMRNRGYSSSEIGRLLKITPRSVQRHVKKIRQENMLTMSVDSQREFIGESINNFRAQYYRLIRISYSNDITDCERVRAIFAACQVQKEAIAIMERLGYLSKQKLEEAEAKLEASDWDPRDDPLISIADKLQPPQRERLLEFIKSEPGYTEEKLLKMAKLFIVENKKLGLYNPDGGMQAS